jgi:hypothetical protein
MTEFDQTSPPHRIGDIPEPPPAPVSPRALSADLRALAEHFREGPVRLAEVVEAAPNPDQQFLSWSLSRLVGRRLLRGGGPES